MKNRFLSRRGAAELIAASIVACFASSASAATGITREDAVRFLEETTFGPTEADIANVIAIGYDAYLEQQFAQTPALYSGAAEVPSNQGTGCPNGNVDNCVTFNYTPFLPEQQLFKNGVGASDQLRRRVSYALAQIFVTSGASVKPAYAIQNYQNILHQDAFANYRTLLNDVTLSPTMGDYLDMVNNTTVNGVAPNENYAREVLQLFSVGLYMMNNKGTYKTDSSGQYIPTYSEDTIEDFARVFTGWTYPVQGTATSKWKNPSYYTGSMTQFDSYHDTTAKTLLADSTAYTTLPAGQNATTDLSQALDNIFYHPNVAPFICKQLIQHLVTANPTTAYVGRVATIFNNNGAGVRGDMKAVVKAILLDTEARTLPTATSYGHLRSPALVLPYLIRSIGGTSDGVWPRSISSQLLQRAFYAPSVFSFYPPDYKLPGTSVYAPESSIYNENTSIVRANAIATLLSGPIAADPSVPNSTGTTADLSSWITEAGKDTTGAALIAKINSLFFHGLMSAVMQSEISTALVPIPTSNSTVRAKAALYIALTSPDFQVEQ
jgi:uncharacterized protein (DUF1800 family)